MAPIGLGYLVEGDYVGDIRTFFCPTALGMPSDYIRRWDDWGTTESACTVRDVQQCGGFDHQTVTHGDWTAQKTWDEGTGNYPFTGLAVQGQYAYRNVPAHIAYWGLGSDQGSYSQVYMRWTKPAVLAEAGSPPFKTQKMLGDRAIVSDTFANQQLDLRQFWFDPNTTEKPGWGQYAHVEGYNVLYGDGNARWFGDSGGRILWPTQTTFFPYNDWICFASRNNNYIWQWRSIHKVSEGGYEKEEPCSMVEWNLFDRASGIDDDDKWMEED
jgi:hypothetical protein